MPVVIIPLLTTLLVGLAMYILLSRPLAWVTEQLTTGLNDMNGSSAILLGIVLGLMMCFDLGGPVNKAAYLFATAGLAAQTTANYRVLAAVMLTRMVPPLALALAAAVRPVPFTEPERENGRAAARCLVHLRGRDPVRPCRPAAGDPRVMAFVPHRPGGGDRGGRGRSPAAQGATAE